MPPAIFARVAAALTLLIGLIQKAIGHPMTYKLIVSDTVEFPVKLSVNDAGVKKEFSLRLAAKRLTQDEVSSTFADSPDLSTADFLRRHVSGWREQRLVVDEGGQAAPFSAEAFEVLLSLFGAAAVIFSAYMEALAQAAGVGGRAKN